MDNITYPYEPLDQMVWSEQDEQDLETIQEILTEEFENA